MTHRILDRVIFYGLLATFIVIAIPYGSVQPWWIALFECVIFTFAILATVDLWMTRDGFPMGSYVALPLVLLNLFVLIQSLPIFAADNPIIAGLRLSISADPFTTRLLAIKLLTLILTGLLLLRYANTEQRVRRLVYIVIFIAVGSALLGLLRRSSGGPGWFFPLPNPASGFAQFVNRNHFAFLVEMGLGLTLGLLVSRPRVPLRLAIFGGVTLLSLVALIISNSRAGIVASLCELLLLVLLVDPFRRFRRESVMGWEWFRNLAGGVVLKLVLVVALIVVFVYGVSWVGGESVVTNFEYSSYSFSHARGEAAHISRKYVWAATWQLIKAQPILGSGFGGYWIAITKYHNASGTYAPQEAHNDYLELLAAGGLVGSALVAWFGVRFAKITRNVLRDSDGFIRQATLGATIGIFGVLIHCFVDFGLHITINSVIFSVLIAIPLACHRLSRRQGEGLFLAREV